MPDLPRNHRLEHGERAHHVVAVVARGVAHGVTDREPGGKVHDGVDAVRTNHVAEACGVVDAAVDDHGGVTRGLPVSRRHIVIHDDPGASGGEPLDRMTADVPRPPCHQNAAHGRPMEMYVKP
jgi:hypothetical protein